ncbi:pentatricopeptide repeat-containing protein [Hibiscus syriacus]|uniref:Pentatricopeptide repeat-containing protein n=1 Tax=Hibiscus syriacus TaxID=106335 RepID=A0A6A3AE79_HIBSY|nr:pentatricopeptide repeat-containing protein [Hibiscus syriacus]
MKPLEKTVSIKGDLQIEKDDDGYSCEPEELSKPPSGSISSLTPDGPPSFRSLSGKSDDGGNGTGSLSRLAGLGRAARRQLVAILDEFWGQLYDFQGQPTQEAKVKKLDVLLAVDSKPLKVDTEWNEYGGCLPLVSGRGSDALNCSSLYDFLKQLKMQNSIDLSYVYSGGSSSLWSNHTQLLDACDQNSNHNVDSGERRYSSLRNVDSGERRYSSLRNVDSDERRYSSLCNVDSNEWRYSSLRAASSAAARDYQPATVHGYQIASYLNRIGKDRSTNCVNDQMELPASELPAMGPTNYRGPLAFAPRQKSQNGVAPAQPPGFENVTVSRGSALKSERTYHHDSSFFGINDNSGISVNTKKYHSLPDISGLSVPHRVSERSGKWDSSIGYGPSIGQKKYGTPMYLNAGSRPFFLDEPSHLTGHRDALPLQLSSGSGTGSLWTRQPFEQFGVAEKRCTAGNEAFGSGFNSVTLDTASGVDLESKLLLSFRHCIVRLLKLDGSDWLFRQNDGADEDLIDRVAARESFLYDAEAREMNHVVQAHEPQHLPSENRYGSTSKNDEAKFANFSISSVPHCGEGCIWKADLIISFGVWCIHRILDLSLMESRPELWGKYTFVLNRLQEYQQRFSPPVSNGMLPPAAKPGNGMCTNAAMLLDIIKDVETAISCRKGRAGTAAGDVAFPKGKENLTSVLKRYKRRLSNKPSGTIEGSGSRNVPTSAPM